VVRRPGCAPRRSGRSCPLRDRLAQRLPSRRKRRAGDDTGQQVAALAQLLHLPAKVYRPRPAHPAGLAFSVRYSSIVRLRRVEVRPSSSCTQPTLETKASMMWIFCSGATISSCRLSWAKSRRPYRADPSEPRPKAPSMTTNSRRHALHLTCGQATEDRRLPMAPGCREILHLLPCLASQRFSLCGVFFAFCSAGTNR